MSTPPAIFKSFPSLSRFDRFLARLSFQPLVNFKNSLKTYFNARRFRDQAFRQLEIGPGLQRIPGFETLNIIDSPLTDYVVDLTRTQYFPAETFDLIYASHVLEHFPWYQAETVFQHLYHLLKPGGQLEIWVPDGLKIAQTLVDYETKNLDNTHRDGWYRFNPDRDPCVWAAGRTFTYGDGDGRADSPNWHRSLFTPRYLKHLFQKTGFKKVKKLSRREIRGYDHGWIGLGYKGIKVKN